MNFVIENLLNLRGEVCNILIRKWKLRMVETCKDGFLKSKEH